MDEDVIDFDDVQSVEEARKELICQHNRLKNAHDELKKIRKESEDPQFVLNEEDTMDALVACHATRRAKTTVQKQISQLDNQLEKIQKGP